MSLFQLLLTPREDGTHLLMIAYNEYKRMPGTRLESSPVVFRFWLRHALGLRIGSDAPTPIPLAVRPRL